MLIDSHCHLEKFAKAGELDGVLERAHEAGVTELITVGTSVEDWELYRRLAKDHPGRIHWTAGLHPCHVEEDWDDQITQLSTYFATDPAPVALGEIGLDHFRLPKFPDEAAEVKSRQEKAFRKQLTLALQFDCPVIVHSRNALEPCIRMIDESGVDWSKVVLHCWVDGPEEIQMLNDRGGRGSFTGILTYKKSETVRDAAREQGLELAMVETDSPYLAPEPHRGKTNEPALVRHVAECYAALFGLELEKFAEQATRNTRSFFGLD